MPMAMINPTVDEFTKPDLGQAAFVALKVPLLAVRPEGRRAVFVFPAPAAPPPRRAPRGQG